MTIKTVSEELKKSYGEKVYRLSLSSGCGCPNRDGTAGYGGCRAGVTVKPGGAEILESAVIELAGYEVAGMAVSKPEGCDLYKLSAYLLFHYPRPIHSIQRMTALCHMAVSSPR